MRKRLILGSLSLIAVSVVIAGVGLAQPARRPGTVTGEARVSGSDQPIVVYVEVEGAGRPPPLEDQSILQRDRRFDPNVLAITRGTTVSFPNDDQIFHNVFSLSRTKRFDLGLYRSGETREVNFNRTGVVDIYCNIHPNMSAHLFVLDSPYFAIVRNGARFLIDGVPPGRHTLVAQPRYGEPTRTAIEVSSRRTVTQNVSVQAERGPRRHTRSDGSPYGRYR